MLVVFVVIVSMLAILAVSGLVVAYVAYPHRGQPIPGAPRLTQALERVAEVLGTWVTEDEEDDPTSNRRVTTSKTADRSGRG